MTSPQAMPRPVVTLHAPDLRGYSHSHERGTLTWIAERLTGLRDDTTPYLLPSQTLDLAAAHTLGVHHEADLFGGVVPFAFVGTKAIAHPLAGPTAPEGWRHDLAERLGDAVLLGFTAFSAEDARAGGRRLLQDGAVRLKPVGAKGGTGQVVARDAHELDRAVDGIDIAPGLVLEANLTDVTTFSIGQVRVGKLVASYYGTQRLTVSASGVECYGGSDLVVARGGYDALQALDIPADARDAVARARAFEDAALACYPQTFASRRNYDVARGRDAAGRWRSGVLEQSWRVGGASSAEILALEALRDDPARRSVKAGCFEVHDDRPPPAGAVVTFAGLDDRVGQITKYAVVEPHDPR